VFSALGRGGELLSWRVRGDIERARGESGGCGCSGTVRVAAEGAVGWEFGEHGA